MSYETIISTFKDSVLTIKLNRPEALNAFNDIMISETTDAFRRASQNPEIRALIITGEGRAFSSGQDLKAVTSREVDFSLGDHLRKGYNRLVLAMITNRKPIIAAVNGVAAGAGCSVALAADIRIASERASFIQIFSRVGLIPDSGSTWLLPRLIGFARAYEMAVTTDRIGSEKAEQWGLVNEIAPTERLMEVANSWAKTLATGPTLAYGLTKKAMHEGFSKSLTESLEYEAQLQEVAGGSQDFREGVDAFIEKREPKFTGN